MTKPISNGGQWKPGQSGNPKGRPGKRHVLTELLRVNGESVISIGGQPIRAQEALAKAVWQFVLTGEVGLMGKHLEANSAAEWASVVKWLYAHVEPSGADATDGETEMVIRVLREDREPDDEVDFTLTPNLPTSEAGEEEMYDDVDFTPPPSPLPASEAGEEDKRDKRFVAGYIPQAIIPAEDYAGMVAFASDEEDWL